jgi:VanZ family protein
LDFSLTRRAARVAGWFLLAIIAFLSLSPPSYRPVTALGHSLEHFSIHLLLGVAFGVGYARRWWLLVFVLVGFMSAIEFTQLFVPGRHARLKDLVIDAGAACLGLGLARLGKVVTSVLFRPSAHRGHLVE